MSIIWRKKNQFSPWLMFCSPWLTFGYTIFQIAILSLFYFGLKVHWVSLTHVLFSPWLRFSFQYFQIVFNWFFFSDQIIFFLEILDTLSVKISRKQSVSGSFKGCILKNSNLYTFTQILEQPRCYPTPLAKISPNKRITLLCKTEIVHIRVLKWKMVQVGRHSKIRFFARSNLLFWNLAQEKGQKYH